MAGDIGRPPESTADRRQREGWFSGSSWGFTPLVGTMPAFWLGHSGSHLATETQQFGSRRKNLFLLAAVSRGGFQSGSVGCDLAESVAPGCSLDLVGSLSQLLPVATPRMSFQCVDPIGHLLHKLVDQFTKVRIGGHLRIDKGGRHSATHVALAGCGHGYSCVALTGCGRWCRNG